jgi:nuclear migration protein JNM1
VVDARDVNFSDRIGADRKSYKISSRRRRHRQRVGSDTDGSNDSEDESLPSRLARLRREAEELRIELEQRDNKDNAADSTAMEDEFAKLNMTLEGLQAPPRHRQDGQPLPEQQTTNTQLSEARTLPPETTASSIAAISSFADRLTSLETALGLSSTLPTSPISSILPTLAQLSTQINTLSSTLSPTNNPTSSLPTLDDLTTRIRTLTHETENLSLSREKAIRTFTALTELRLRTAETIPYGHGRNPSHQETRLATQTNVQLKEESKLFLTEQSSKISALYELLPTIQSLHPLLPTVLDRLRSLQVVHAGAAEARADLEEIERRQGMIEGEIKRWKEGLEAVEKGVKECDETGKGNVEVVQKMVDSLEGRLAETLKKT